MLSSVMRLEELVNWDVTSTLKPRANRDAAVNLLEIDV